MIPLNEKLEGSENNISSYVSTQPQYCYNTQSLPMWDLARNLFHLVEIVEHKELWIQYLPQDLMKMNNLRVFRSMHVSIA